MQSLQSLNEYGNRLISFTDERPAKIIYDRPVPTNFSLTFNEGQPHNIPLGIDITEIINIEAFTEIPYYTISATLPGVTVTWNTLPEGCVITNDSPGVYTISGITSKEIWDQVKSPTIRLPNSFNGNWSYTASIVSTYGVKQWVVNLTFIDVTSLSVPSKMYFDEGTSQLVTGNPLIIDEGTLDPTWLLEVVPSVPSNVSNFSSVGSGGTTSFNNTSKVYTIVGKKEEVNSHLNNLYLVTSPSANQNMTLTYTCNNNVTFEADNKYQDLRLNSIKYIGAPIHAAEYSEDVFMPAGTFPVSLITDIDESGSGPYTIYLKAHKFVAGQYISLPVTWTVGGTGGVVSIDNQNIISITGTRNVVNSRLEAISCLPPADYSDTIILSYTLKVNDIVIENKSQNIICIAPHDEISYIELWRGYIPGTSSDIFTLQTPQITDLDTRTIVYTLTLSTSNGTFSSPGISSSSTYTISGSKSVVNSTIPTISFTPNSGLTTNGTMNYTFKKNNTVVKSGSTTLYAPDYIFDVSSPVPQTITVDEGSTHNVPIGIDILSINPAGAYTMPRSYTVDVSSCPGATVKWTTLPYGVTVSNPSPGVYTVSGFSTVYHWNQIKSPQVTLPAFFYGTFTYSATIPADNSAKSWTVTATVIQVSPITAPSTFYYTSGSTQTLTGVSLLNNLANPGYVWTVTITPSRIDTIASFSTSGSGGSINIDPTTKIITVSGTPTQVNSHLTTISYTSIDHNDFTFYLDLSVSNTGDSRIYTSRQKLSSNDYSVLSATRSDQIYYKNTQANVQGGPLITDSSSNSLEDYYVEIYPSDVLSTSSMSVTGTLTNDLYNQIQGPTGKTIGYAIDATSDSRYIFSTFRGDDSFALGGLATGSGWIVYDTSSEDAVEVFRYTYPAKYTPSGSSSQELNMLYIKSSDDGSTVITSGQNSQTFITVWAKGSGWTYSQEYFIITSTNNRPEFGFDISSDGNTMLCGAYIYTRSNSEWALQNSRPWESVFISNLEQTGENDPPPMLSMSKDGNTLVLSARVEGKVYVYTRSGDTWTLQQTIVQSISNYIRLSGDGNTFVVTSNTTPYDWKLCIYHRAGGVWELSGQVSENMGATQTFAINYSGTSIVLVRTTALLKYDLVSGSWSYTGFKAVDNPGLNNQWTTYNSMNDILISATGRSITCANPQGINYYNGVIRFIKLYAIRGSWDSSSHKLTFFGGKSEVNSTLDLIKLSPATNYEGNFELIYKATTPSGEYSLRNQFVFKG